MFFILQSLNGSFISREVKFSPLRILLLPVSFGTGKETHTSSEREEVTNVITQQERERKFLGIWASCQTQGEFNNLDIDEVN
jgi:hypothetical protein